MVKAIVRVRRLAARAAPVALILIGCGMIVVALALLADDAVAEIPSGADTRAAGVALQHVAGGRSAHGETANTPRTESSDDQRIHLLGDLGVQNPTLAQAVEHSSFGGGYAEGGRLALAISASSAQATHPAPDVGEPAWPAPCDADAQARRGLREREAGR
jgi:hypothetical protein